MKQAIVTFLFSLVVPLALLGQDQRVLTDVEKDALQAANAQLVAYNNRDIDAFMDAYADNVKVFTFPDKLRYESKEVMRENYKRMFQQAPLLHCTVVSEIVEDNKVIHEESVVFNNPDEPIHAVCIYIVENGKIAEVYFL